MSPRLEVEGLTIRNGASYGDAGLTLAIGKGRAVVHLAHRFNTDAIQVVAELPLPGEGQ